MKVKQKISQLGIGLLELMLSLAIIAVLLVMATRYYEVAHTGEQVNAAVGVIQSLRGASAQWAAGKPGYTGVSLTELDSYGLLPKSIKIDGSNSNPWGGSVDIQAAGTGNNQVQITMTAVPVDACANIKGKLDDRSIVATCSSGTLTVDFG